MSPGGYRARGQQLESSSAIAVFGRTCGRSAASARRLRNVSSCCPGISGLQEMSANQCKRMSTRARRVRLVNIYIFLYSPPFIRSAEHVLFSVGSYSRTTGPCPGESQAHATPALMRCEDHVCSVEVRACEATTLPALSSLTSSLFVRRYAETWWT